MKRALRTAASLPFRLLPNVLRHRLIQAVLDATAGQPAREAMRALLAIDESLLGRINEVAMRYDNGIHVKHRLMKYHDFFVEHIRSGERVVDIGCGYGAVAYSIVSRSGADVTGIDLSIANIGEARRRFQHPKLTWLEGDALTDLPQGPYDTAILSNVLEHIEHRVEFLKALQRQPAPKRLLIRVPMFNRDWKVPLRKELGMTYFSDPTHFTEYTRESFETEMTQAGLTITDLQIAWGELWAEVSAHA